MERGRRARRWLALIVAAGLAGSLLSTPAGADDGAGSGSVGAVTWGACPADVAEKAPQLECAEIPVPLDYDEPHGTTIKITVSRQASSDPAKRRGILLLNPGGPGGAGLSQPADLVNLGAPASVLDSYDLIGMDPRGVGHSSPVSCGFTADQDYRGNIPPFAADAAAVERQAEAARKIADQCAEHDQDGRLRHLTTANTARDLDRIRVALGEQKLNFFGLSYGSALGAAYASLFPETTDRLIIDSNVGDTHLGYEGMRQFGLGAEQTFPAFAKFAAARHDAYGLGRTPAAVRRNYLELAERLDREPVDGVDGALARFLVFVGLYSEKGFAPTAQLLQALGDSDAAAVRRRLAERPPVGPAQPSTPAEKKTDALSPYDNTWSAFLAVTCNDSDWPEDVATYQREVAKDRARFPLYGAAGSNINPCAFWHHEPSEPPVAINDNGPANVLVVQNRRDPATPYLGGLKIRQAFGDRARLVSVDGVGHGVYLYDDDPCAMNVATQYLVDGTWPRRDVTC
ncbi:alpha/beta hydrolase [Microlunatus parietis]|uniref:Pimeloyl-ACP methyl ester carboxylesterase n=1 Tax=Microlunatus parietis TaxID=682979 RepID=A0A7Y9LGD9_9ACTN|nr:alpha/beta hydrolase [Microlunatus parietis]NYE75076.1 pimeloyl-ACP methyl ester carboxylesterase [Microlunatus parietis]